MEAAARLVYPESPEVVFEDGLGQRFRLADPLGGPGGEVLALRPSFAAVPSFEFALRERTARLASWRHPQVSHVRGIERGIGTETQLRVVSDAEYGIRLSDLLCGVQSRRLTLDIGAGLCLTRQLLRAVAALHDALPDVAHGALAPERILLTPQARLMVVEPVLGAALEQLRYPAERYWTELRIALAPDAQPPRFDHRTDVLQAGLIALALILGRPLRDEEFPAGLHDLLSSLAAISASGAVEPLPAGLRRWLGRALQIDADRPFRSAVDARTSLEVLLGDNELIASQASLVELLARYESSGENAGGGSSGKPHSRLGIAADAPSEEMAADLLAIAAPVAPKSAPRTARRAKTVLLADDVWPEPWSTSGEEPDADAKRWWRNWRLIAVVLAVLAVFTAGATLAARRQLLEFAEKMDAGTLHLPTSFPGTEALVDGVRRGIAPISLALNPGARTAEPGGGTKRRTPVANTPSTKASQNVKLPHPPAADGPVSDRPLASVSTPTRADRVEPTGPVKTPVGDSAASGVAVLEEMPTARRDEPALSAEVVVSAPPLSAPGALADGLHGVSPLAATPPPPPPPLASTQIGAVPSPRAVPARPAIFSADDRSVVAPQPLAQVVPPFRADLAAERQGVLELVIDEAGRVERVELHGSIEPRYDRMLIDAAREWRYQPATRDGAPVRYRKIVRVAVGRPR